MLKKFLRIISWTILFYSCLFFLLLIYVIFISPETSKELIEMWNVSSPEEKQQLFKDLIPYLKHLLLPLGAGIVLWLTRKKKPRRETKRERYEEELTKEPKANLPKTKHKSSAELGRIGEENVASVLEKLPNSKYRVINDIMLIEGRKSVNIDHIIVSIYGVVVIETKNMKDIVYAYERFPYWRQKTFWSQKSYDFYNPILQNKGHIKFLKRILPYDVSYINLVVFASECELRGDIWRNPNVIKLDELYSRLDELSGFCNEVISTEEVESIYRFLNDRNITDENQRRKHIEKVKRIKRNYSDDPNLGEFLIKLDSKYEEKDKVKRRGAWWSEEKRTWYISEQNDLNFFKEWLPDRVNVFAWEPFYLCGGVQKCWKCEREIEVVSFASDNYKIVVDGDLREGFSDFKIFSEIEYMDQVIPNNELEKILKKYFPRSHYKYDEFTNYCCYCGRPQKDFYLHNKQDGVFNLRESLDLSKITFLEIPLDFAVGLRVKEYQQFKLARDKLQIISLTPYV